MKGFYKNPNHSPLIDLKNILWAIPRYVHRFDKGKIEIIKY